MSAKIIKRKPAYWRGRYNIVYGNKSSVLSIKRFKNRWWPTATLIENDEVTICPSIECQASYDLANIVNNAKRLLSNSEGGGSFIINEFGQIIVPSSYGNGERMYVGEINGTLQFFNPNTTQLFDFGDNGLKSGDEWKKPYLGVEFKLSYNNKISQKIINEDGEQNIFPEQQDMDLIAKLRKIRPSGGCRFIVNHQKIVLTKKEYSKYDWRPIYVGHINYNKWFKKEE
jgi:hypothetical protein